MKDRWATAKADLERRRKQEEQDTSFHPPFVGQVGVLSVSPKGYRGAPMPMNVARSLAAALSLERYENARDEFGVSYLRQTGEAFEVGGMTRVRVIERETESIWRVRLLTGQHEGREAWVYTLFIHPR